MTRLTTASGDALDPQAVATADQARAEVRERLAQAGFVIGQSGDTLYVASAASVSQSGLLTSRVQALAAAQHRTLTVTDLARCPRPTAAASRRSTSRSSWSSAATWG